MELAKSIDMLLSGRLDENTRRGKVIMAPRNVSVGCESKVSFERLLELEPEGNDV